MPEAVNDGFIAAFGVVRITRRLITSLWPERLEVRFAVAGLLRDGRCLACAALVHVALHQDTVSADWKGNDPL